MNNSDIQGYFSINTEKYSINDLVTALVAQGIAVQKVGTNLKIGQKIINPIVNSNLNYSQRIQDPVNENVIQGLASQIQRIFNELNKLKDHLGVNSELVQEIDSGRRQLFDFSSYDNKSTSPKSFSQKSKWENFVQSKNFDLEPQKFEPNDDPIFKVKNDTPIITLGRKKNSSVIDEYKDLVTNKGFPDDDALDSLSTKLFNTASSSQYNYESKQDLMKALSIPQGEKPSAATTEFTTFLFTKCDQCNSKIPNEAQFCSKCGTKKEVANQV